MGVTSQFWKVDYRSGSVLKATYRSAFILCFLLRKKNKKQKSLQGFFFFMFSVQTTAPFYTHKHTQNARARTHTAPHTKL